MKLIFDDATFSLSFQLLRAIGGTYYKGADIGECLSSAYKIKKVIFKVGIMNALKQQKSSSLCTRMSKKWIQYEC
jgi:hypothetical protein